MKLAGLAPALLAGGLFAPAWGGGGTATAPPSASVRSDLSISSFTADFSYMAKLAALTKAGKGMVGVILPGTTSSARYVAFDQPYLTQAFQKAGYSSSQFKIDNAQGQEAQQLSIAQADITAGATVLIMDPLNSSVGSQIQAYAQSHGVKIISYDRATFTGTNTYYVSFDNVQVGKLIGKGFTDCVTAWGVKNPKVFTLNGGQNSDPNAVDVAKGYNSVICGGSVALATVLRAGATPPSGLVNGTTAPPSGVSGNQQPASLLVPVWVDKSNMEATVIKDKFIDVATLCSKAGASVCSANNIS